MLSTAISVLAAVALLMPGFVVVELSLARSARRPESGLALALRAISYALIIHLVFGYWTVWLATTIEPPADIDNHVVAITAYVSVVLIGVPILLGAGLNKYLSNVECQVGQPNLFAAALGAGAARDAFDFAYQQWQKEGAYVVVELVGHTRTEPRLVGGVYGKGSAVGQTPEPHDIYLETLCTVSEDVNGVRNLELRIEPERGLYIPADQIARIDLIPAATL